jgi:hypothetical protein
VGGFTAPHDHANFTIGQAHVEARRVETNFFDQRRYVRIAGAVCLDEQRSGSQVRRHRRARRASTDFGQIDIHIVHQTGQFAKLRMVGGQRAPIGCDVMVFYRVQQVSVDDAACL